MVRPGQGAGSSVHARQHHNHGRGMGLLEHVFDHFYTDAAFWRQQKSLAIESSRAWWCMECMDVDFGPRTQEAEARGHWERGQHGLYREHVCQKKKMEDLKQICVGSVPQIPTTGLNTKGEDSGVKSCYWSRRWQPIHFPFLAGAHCYQHCDGLVL